MGQRRGVAAAAWRAVAWACGWAALACLTACRNPTQISLSITSNACATHQVSTSIALGQPNDVDEYDEKASTEACTAPGGVVGTFVVVPSGADDEQVGIQVAMALQGGDAGIVSGPSGACDPMSRFCILARRALPYVPHQNVNLPIALDLDCAGVPCGDDQTCSMGACVSAACGELPNGCGAGDGGVDGAPNLTTEAGSTGADSGTSSDTSVHDAAVQDSTRPEASAPDAPASVDAGCDAASGCYVVPQGWSLVAFDPAASTTSCPTNFVTQDVLADAQASPSLCTYGCMVTMDPGCGGSMPVMNGILCGGDPTTWPAGSGCTAQSISGGFGVGIKAAPPTQSSPGACTVTATETAPPPNAAICSPPSPCTDAWCQVTFSTDTYRACVTPTTTSSPSTCPPDFPNPVSFATTGTTSCPPVPPCSVQCQDSLTLFTKSNCSPSQYDQTIVVDGTCNGVNTNFAAYEFSSQGACSVGTAGAPTITPNDPQTLCCH